MAPTLIVVGLLLGRWWRLVVPAAVVGWVAALGASGDLQGLSGWLAAVAVAAANVLVGVAAYQLLARVVRGARAEMHGRGPLAGRVAMWLVAFVVGSFTMAGVLHALPSGLAAFGVAVAAGGLVVAAVVTALESAFLTPRRSPTHGSRRLPG